jgi:hypothetical protein
VPDVGRRPMGRWQVPEGEGSRRDGGAHPTPHLRSMRAVGEEEVPPRLWEGACHAHFGGRTTLGEDVGSRAEPIDVGEVREDSHLGGQPKPLGRACGYIQGMSRGEHAVCLPCVERWGRGSVDRAKILPGGKDSGAQNAPDILELALGSSSEAGLE